MTALGKSRTILDIFPIPEFLLLSTTGIAITDQDTKLVELHREALGDGFKLTHSTQTANPKGAINAGVISNKSEMTSVLKDLANRHNTHYVRATLPEEKGYLFTTIIDWVAPEDLQDSVAFTVEENVPLSLADAVFSFDVIKEDQAANEIKLAVAVMPREVVDEYITLFESAGITPVTFDIESQAIARALIPHNDEHSYLILNLSTTKTGFYVAERRVVKFSTILSYGINANNEQDHLGDVKDELNKVLAFWSTHKDKLGRPENPIEKIILCGEGATHKGLVDKLMEGTTFPYEPGDAWINLSRLARSQVSKDIADKSLEYVSAIGAALSCEK